MRLTLVVPGLLWPRQALLDTVFDLRLPSLEKLLGYGKRTRAVRVSEAGWWLQSFGLALRALPSAPLRLLALGADPADAAWLCADPVHLEIGAQGIALDDPSDLDLGALEAQALHATLAPIFSALGELEFTAPYAWHLRLKCAAPEVAPELSALLGNCGDALLPGGDAGRPWRRALNDAQIALHEHPVNLARAAAGKIAINSLALWGAGQFPFAPQSRSQYLYSDDPVIRGLGLSAKIGTLPLPPGYVRCAGSTLVHWNRTNAASRMHDAGAWRDALSTLERDWLAPAMAALGNGELKTLEMIAFGEDESLALVLHRADLLKFWRRPSPLESLAQ